MFTSAIVALLILFRQSRLPLAKLMKSMEPAIASAGVIILITAAGGAFGAMIRHSGVGDVIQSAIGFNASGTMILIVAFAISATMKIAQGSSTVALITASAIMYPVISGIGLPYHPVYVFLAIGFGAMVFSWMNDSGFWVVGKMSGFTELETLRTWTIMFAMVGVVGFLQVLLLASLLPLKFLP
jgi:GntP family gluconate:H+ symporter